MHRPWQSAQVSILVIAGLHLAAGARPNARYLCLAARTTAVGRDPIRANQVAVAIDQSGLALGTAGVLPLADAAGQVAGVDKAQAFFRANLGGPHECLWRGRLRVGHPVILVERRDVPRNVRTNRSQKTRDLPQLVGAVVESRYH